MTVTDQASVNLYVAADAVAMAASDATPWKAVWTPTLPRRDEYEVYARWPAAAANASDAPYTIYYEGGSTTVTKNQQATGNSWQLLGTFIMAPGQSHRVELADTANGNLIADAVKFVPKAAAKTATWTFAVASTGSYKLYAKWPASSAHATDAQYTVTHASGTSTVTANQRTNGGQWNLLGTYSFNAGASYKVDLSDQVAAGKVAADAIYIAGTGAPTDTFTWTPTFPSAGTYQVYARWPASSANTSAAQYTVTRDGGTSSVTLNQKQNGGAWVLLGSYNFTPGAGQKVTLAASADGTTIADALLFVGAGAQPANLLYVHADHLGTPQKMTDASQATAWDGVFDPFGEEVALTGLAAMPMRFPGQYADDETGYSYNYSRDYDPTLGRYVQSDPIGLNGGMNTYAYVTANPVSLFDPTGLAPGAGRPPPDPGPAPDSHTQRNRHNKCPKDKPEDGEVDCRGNLWTEDWWIVEQRYHGGNDTYRSPDPNSEGGFQCSYDDDGNLDLTGDDRGTYDYVRPSSPYWPGEGHRTRDMEPHDSWPDSYEDPDQTEVYDCGGCER